MRLLGSFYLLLAASIWGGMYVVSRAVMEFIPPYTLLEMRMAISTLTLGAIALYSKKARVAWGDLPFLCLVGIIGCTISIGTQFMGTHLASASAGGLITSASPAFIALFAAWLLRERLSLPKAAALALATAGVLVVSWPAPGSLSGASVFAGNIYLAVAAITWALYTVLAKVAARRYSPLTVTLYASMVTCLTNLPMLRWELSSQALPPVPSWAWWGVAYIGVVSTAVAFYLWNLGFSLMDAGSASLFFFAQPVVAGILGSLVLGEQLGTGFFTGGALIVVAVMIASLNATPVRQPQ